jgi:hypothetical protein
MAGRPSVFRPLSACRHAAKVGTISAIAIRFLNTVRLRLPLVTNRLARRRQIVCDKAHHKAAVMLHLLSRYVSKAAILTVPVLPVPAENRSPA